MFTIIKRNGSVVDFDVNFIRKAVVNANRESKLETLTKSNLDDLIAFVEEHADIGESGHLQVEAIQDVVEKALMSLGFPDTAVLYIRYRERQKTRRALAKNNPIITTAVSLIKENSHGLRIDPSLIIKSDIPESPQGLDIPALLDQIILKVLDNVAISEDMDILAGRLLLQKYRLLAETYLRETHGVERTPEEIVKVLVNEEIYSSELFSPSVALTKHFEMIDEDRDFQFNYLSAKTLTDRYLVKTRSGTVLETPQMMFFRMAVAMSSQVDTLSATQMYDDLSTLNYFHSTPSMFNAGLVRPQMASCYLSTLGEDSLEGIFNLIHDNARLSKFAGGLGISITPARAEGAPIRGTNGTSNGVIPWLKNIEMMAVSVDQGSKRSGSACVYLDSWHADIWKFLQLRAEGGDEYLRTHTLDTANWIPDLLLERAEKRETWSMFSPDEVSDLIELKGAEFNERYEHYERMGENGELRIFHQSSAYDLLKEMLSQLAETGASWINFKDPSAMRYMGSTTETVKSSNLCTEILEPANAEETAVCTLGSIVLTNHISYPVGSDIPTINWTKIATTVETMVRALDTTIDYNFYPSKLAETSNNRYRHIGMGIAGMQDLLSTLRIPFDSEEAVDLNHKLMEYISYHAIMTSIDLAKDHGPFPKFEGSHWAQGKVPLDLYREFHEYRNVQEFERFSTPSMDWDVVRSRLLKYGIRNATLIAIAPTATSSNICMTSPSIEPTFSNIFVKSNLSGTFKTVNPVLRRQLEELDLWDEELIDEIYNAEGSIAKIERIPEEIRRLHKTSFEIDPIWITKNGAGRGVWIDQSQSLNYYIKAPTGRKLYDTYMTAWKYALKTTYYLRTLEADEVQADEEVNLAEVPAELTPPSLDFVGLDSDEDATPAFCNMEEGCLVCQ